MKGISIFIFMENFKYSRDRPSFKPPQLAYIIIRGIKEIKRERGEGKGIEKYARNEYVYEFSFEIHVYRRRNP